MRSLLLFASSAVLATSSDLQVQADCCTCVAGGGGAACASRCTTLSSACQACISNGGGKGCVDDGRCACSYSESRAVIFAKLAGAAYCPESSIESWNCGVRCSESVTKIKVCQGSTTKAFVGLWENKGLVSFQGTHGFNAFVQDLKIAKDAETYWSDCSGCKVHSGFLNEWKSLKSCVKGHFDSLGGKKIRTTGHSLGAALSIIAAMDLHHSGYVVEESYDFGRPRTGSEEFAQACESVFGNKVYRVTHHKDPVVQLPPDEWGIIDWHFEHSGPEVFYDAERSTGYEICADSHDKTCSAQYWAVTPSIDDHLTYVDFRIADCDALSLANATVI